MKYDFDRVIDRTGTNSLKWDIKPGELPMWVADMDFETAPCVRDAIARRVAQGVFGYTIVPEDWARAYTGWWERRHHFHMEEEWLVFSAGVIPTISSAVRKLTTPAENVLVQTPCYNIFFNCIYNNGRNILENRLVYDGEKYHIDWERLEEQLADPQTTLMLLCNPHNPIGKIWDSRTLERIGELCASNGVTVLSDEIHCDLTDPGKEYVPFASVSETCRRISLTCIAPTKTFNLAGLQTSAVVAADPKLRHKIWRGLNTDEVGEPNAFAVDAAIAAFTEGEEWLDELRRYLYENKRYVEEFVRRKLPQVRLARGEATYLMWLDISGIGGDVRGAARRIRKETGLYLSGGKAFRGDGEKFLRLNIACPRTLVEDGMKRLKRGIESIKDC